MESHRLQQLLFFAFFDVPAFTFHVSMLVFILQQIKANPKLYFQGFYILYAAVSVVDLYYVISTAITIRPGVVGFFVEQYLAWSFGAKIFNESQNYCAWFQVTAHTVIAFNRFAGFCLSEKYDRLWRGRPMAIILILLTLSPIPGLCTCITASAHYEVFSNGKFMAVYNDKHVDELFWATKIVTMCYYIPQSALAFFFNMRTFLKYKQLRKMGMLRSHRHEQDVRLLVHTIFMLCIQWLRLGYYVTMIGNVMKSDVLLNFLGAWSQKEFGFRFAIADAYALLGSVSLFALSSTVRRGYLEFYGIWKKKIAPAPSTLAAG